MNNGPSKDGQVNGGSEAEHLLSFRKKQQVIRDRVKSIVHGYQTGVYLVGRPGTSKTYTVREELEQCNVPWSYLNGRVTPMGLFSFVAERTEHVIVFDDVPSIFKHDQAVQILLALLDGKPNKPRLISYKSMDIEQKVHFTGSIIAISNIPLRCDPLARALGSRIVCVEHEPTDEEVAAFIRSLAKEGFEDLPADDCLEVAEFLIAETRQFDLRLDLRHLTKAWQDFRQHKHGNSITTWKDLVRTSLLKATKDLVEPISKQMEIERQRQCVREAIAKHPNNRDAQLTATGLKKSTFYVRLNEVSAGHLVSM